MVGRLCIGQLEGSVTSVVEFEGAELMCCRFLLNLPIWGPRSHYVSLLALGIVRFLELVGKDTASCWEGYMASCLEGTFQNIIKNFKTNSHVLNLKWPEYLCLVKRNPQIYLALKLVQKKGVKKRTYIRRLYGF